MDHPDEFDGRHESVDQRVDRNWIELLQELRVTQTGVQLIAGFLLTLPFQSRFADLDDFARALYLGLVILAAVTVGLTLAPISIHRRVFRRHVKQRLVSAAHRLVQVSLVAITFMITGITVLVFHVVVGGAAALVSGIAVFLVFCVLLLAIPLLVARPPGSMSRVDEAGR